MTCIIKKTCSHGTTIILKNDFKEALEIAKSMAKVKNQVIIVRGL